MPRLVFWLYDALGLSSPHSSQRSKPVRHNGKSSRRRNVVGQTICGERLELRCVPSATPIVATAIPVSGFENAPLTNVPVASFTQGGGTAPASNFVATVFWGDGSSSAGTIVESGTSYLVYGSHTYTDVSNAPIVVGIQDATTPSNIALVTDQATILPLLPDGTQGTADQRFVYETLKDTFQRPISMDEINYWTAQYEKNHQDPQTFAYMLLEVTPPYEYDLDQIDSSFETYLHRAADPAGENYFLTLKLNSQGTTSGPGTETRTAALLINSDEFYADAGGTVDGFITAVFEDALKRAPSASDLAFFSDQLTHGLTRIEFATTVLNSYEFQVEQINSLFERYLGRPADPAGLAAFINNDGLGYGTTSNTETLLDTPEFYDRAVGLPLNTVEIRD